MGFSGKNTGEGCHALLQGIFPTQGSNPSLTSPAWAARFFTTSATWEALEGPMLVIGNMPEILGFIFRTHADFAFFPTVHPPIEME